MSRTTRTSRQRKAQSVQDGTPDQGYALTGQGVGPKPKSRPDARPRERALDIGRAKPEGALIQGDRQPAPAQQGAALDHKEPTANGIVTGTAEKATVKKKTSGPGKTMTNGGVEAGGMIPTGKRTQVRTTRRGGRRYTQLSNRSKEQKLLRRKQER